VKGNTVHYRATVAKSWTKRGLKCVVARDAGLVVGYIFYQPQSIIRADESYIKEMGVHPAQGGKKIGTLLPGYAIAHAEETLSTTVKLYTTTGASSKQAFYQPFEFVTVPAHKYNDEGYTTDDESPDTTSLLMKGDVKTVWGNIKAKLNI
jgi:predicted N-acetyltransferase YhbS